jgi:mono/diheme cytochrome c family protein
MKHLKLIIIFSFINIIAVTNVAAFGVEAAMAEKEQAATVIAENTVVEDKVSKEPAAQSPLSAMENQHIGNPESIEAGRAKYGNTCLFCHGAKGVGARAPTLVAGGFAPGGVINNEFFITTIKYGRPGTIMGSFEGTITETEMWQVIAYLRDQAEKVAAMK